MTDPRPTLPAPSPLAQAWTLDPSVVYLNHGSFGATPRSVLERQSELRAQLEGEPVRFFDRDLEGFLDSVRATLGAMLGADPDDLAAVPNATSGVNTVVRSLDFSPGDELLTTDHAYNACENALRYVASRTGARVVRAAAELARNAHCERLFVRSDRRRTESHDFYRMLGFDEVNLTFDLPLDP